MHAVHPTITPDGFATVAYLSTDAHVEKFFPFLWRVKKDPIATFDRSRETESWYKNQDLTKGKTGILSGKPVRLLKVAPHQLSKEWISTDTVSVLILSAERSDEHPEVEVIIPEKVLETVPTSLAPFFSKKSPPYVIIVREGNALPCNCSLGAIHRFIITARK